MSAVSDDNSFVNFARSLVTIAILMLSNIYIYICDRAVRYDDIYRMDEIKSLVHVIFYRLFRGVAKYIVYLNTFSSFEWLRSLYAVWRGQNDHKTRSSLLNEDYICSMVTRF